MKKYIFQAAFNDKSPWALAQIMNHFKVGPEWFRNPKVTPELLVRELVKAVGAHPRQTLSQPIIDKIKELVKWLPYDLIEMHEGEYRSKIVMSAVYDSSEAYDYIESYYREVSCPECGAKEVIGEDEFVEWNFKEVGPYQKCNSCCKLFRAKLDPIHYTMKSAEHLLDQEMQMQFEGVEELLKSYCEHHYREFDGFYIEGRNLNWRGSSGYHTCSIKPDDLLSALTVNSDYTLELEWRTDGTLEATCAHHDATSGYTVTPTHRCDLSGEFIKPIDLEDAKRLAKVYNILEQNKWDVDYVDPEGWEYIYFNSLSEKVNKLIQTQGCGITVEFATLLMEVLECS